MTTRIKTKAELQREAKHSYKNFNVAVFCPVGNINRIQDFNEFSEKFRLLSDNMKIGRVYIEDFRGMVWASKEQLLRVKEYFEGLGIACSGAITTNDDGKEGYASLCYSDEEHVDKLRNAVKLNAEIFDEFIFDDFFFTNCRCEKCIANKGDRSWSEFRLEQKKWVDEEIVMKTAKSINPDINVILKYPQWYEVHNETGYDLGFEPQIYDTIYTGTETRNPDYAQQHLPKYLSYFTQRYYESAAPGRNLGGWFDPYECSYNLTSYLEQNYLTLFAKAKEITLFCLDSMILDTSFRTFAPAVGETFRELDEYLDKLGNPVGAMAYRPHNARGEDNLHNYLGMCGIPFEPCIEYPEGAGVIFLTEGAVEDRDIAAKMKKSMLEGADVIVTSGFVRKLGKAFEQFVNVTYSDRKALVNEYANTKDNGLTVSGKYMGSDKILIPQLDYATNDIWELAGAYGRGNNYPIVLRCQYGKGHICIITIPDNPGDLYTYPVEVWEVLRGLFCKEMPVSLSGPSGIQIFEYDNDMVIIRSDLPYTEDATLLIHDKDVKKIQVLNYNREYEVVEGKVRHNLMPGVNYVLKLDKSSEKDESFDGLVKFY